MYQCASALNNPTTRKVGGRIASVGRRDTPADPAFGGNAVIDEAAGVAAAREIAAAEANFPDAPAYRLRREQ